ncbi:hypothetical protein ACG2K1_00055 [Neisseria sp. 23W00296]|uniref:hypothetical protein n=1 Tax=unclassified Neisseria TaxID=2623750 RepID=UPI003757B9A1
MDGPDYGNPAALAEFRIRLGAQADLGYSIFGVGRVSFQTDETGRVLTAERDISDAEGYTRLKYSYWNGQPFSLALQYAGADKQEGIQTFIYVNRQWLPLRPETPLPAAYRNCAACTDEAHALLAEKEKLANGESPEQAALAHATAAAKRNIGLIDKRDLPELMIEGATKNSLTLGTTKKGVPKNSITASATAAASTATSSISATAAPCPPKPRRFSTALTAASTPAKRATNRKSSLPPTAALRKTTPPTRRPSARLAPKAGGKRRSA